MPPDQMIEGLALNLYMRVSSNFYNDLVYSRSSTITS